MKVVDEKEGDMAASMVQQGKRAGAGKAQSRQAQERSFKRAF